MLGSAKLCSNSREIFGGSHPVPWPMLGSEATEPQVDPGRAAYDFSLRSTTVYAGDLRCGSLSLFGALSPVFGAVS